MIPYNTTKQKSSPAFSRQGFSFVGVAGFEPAASTSQMWRDTGLRYTPSGLQRYIFKNSVQIFFKKDFSDCLNRQNKLPA
jgi:hypothetical protein